MVGAPLDDDTEDDDTEDDDDAPMEAEEDVQLGDPLGGDVQLGDPLGVGAQLGDPRDDDPLGDYVQLGAPLEPRKAPCFVRVIDLGGVVGFVPTAQEHDGDKRIDPGVDFWDRKQYVVGCYPTE